MKSGLNLFLEVALYEVEAAAKKDPELAKFFESEKKHSTNGLVINLNLGSSTWLDFAQAKSGANFKMLHNAKLIFLSMDGTAKRGAVIYFDESQRSN